MKSKFAHFDERGNYHPPLTDLVRAYLIARGGNGATMKNILSVHAEYDELDVAEATAWLVEREDILCHLNNEHETIYTTWVPF